MDIKILVITLQLFVIIILFYRMFQSVKSTERAVLDEKERMGTFLDVADVMVVSYDSEGIITEINNKGCEVLGYSSLELIGKNWFDTVQLPENKNSVKLKYARIIQKEIPSDEYYKQVALTKSGEKINITWHSTMLQDSDGALTGALCSGMDITNLLEMENNLLMLFAAVEQSPSIVIITDLEGGMEYVNPKFTEITGYEKNEVLGRNPRILKSGHFTDDVYRDLWNLILSGGEWRGEFLNKKKNGDFYWEAASVSSIKDVDGNIRHYLAVKEDITRRVEAEEKIRASLEEKKALLRELYHRTKNNMQVISAILNLSSSKIDDDRVSIVFNDVNNRIQSMSMVHEKLYQSQNLSSIDFKEYIIDLCSSLEGSYCLADCNVSFIYNLEDVSVLIDAAIPLGLIITELISNSFKHAFPGMSEGEIRISLTNQDDSFVKLEIGDNGVGTNPDFSIDKLETMGLQTIFSIGESQLHGNIELDTSFGFKFSLAFNNDVFKTRV